jgi:hypothetical protein
MLHVVNQLVACLLIISTSMKFYKIVHGGKSTIFSILGGIVKYMFNLKCSTLNYS